MNKAVRTMSESIELEASCHQVFDALIRPSAICQWWQANRAIVFPEPDGVWVASWGENQDDPDYLTAARMSRFDPPHRIVMTDYDYRSRFGPLPFEAHFVTAFELEETPVGCQLKITQSGFPLDPIADEFYAGCCLGWKTTLKQLKEYLDVTLTQRTGG